MNPASPRRSCRLLPQTSGPHPDTDFSAFRFSARYRLSGDEPPRDQSVELCFHDGWHADPERPVSLHFDNRNNVLHYPEPPDLPAPEEPAAIVEGGTLHLVSYDGYRPSPFSPSPPLPPPSSLSSASRPASLSPVLSSSHGSTFSGRSGSPQPAPAPPFRWHQLHPWVRSSSLHSQTAGGILAAICGCLCLLLCCSSRPPPSLVVIDQIALLDAVPGEFLRLQTEWGMLGYDGMDPRLRHNERAVDTFRDAMSELMVEMSIYHSIRATLPPPPQLPPPRTHSCNISQIDGPLYAQAAAVFDASASPLGQTWFRFDLKLHYWMANRQNAVAETALHLQQAMLDKAGSDAELSNEPYVLLTNSSLNSTAQLYRILAHRAPDPSPSSSLSSLWAWLGLLRRPFRLTGRAPQPLDKDGALHAFFSEYVRSISNVRDRSAEWYPVLDIRHFCALDAIAAMTPPHPGCFHYSPTSRAGSSLVPYHRSHAARHIEAHRRSPDSSSQLLSYAHSLARHRRLGYHNPLGIASPNNYHETADASINVFGHLRSIKEETHKVIQDLHLVDEVPFEFPALRIARFLGQSLHAADALINEASRIVLDGLVHRGGDVDCPPRGQRTRRAVEGVLDSDDNDDNGTISAACVCAAWRDAFVQGSGGQGIFKPEWRPWAEHDLTLGTIGGRHLAKDKGEGHTAILLRWELPKNRYLLRRLSGPNAGAAELLRFRTYLWGETSACVRAERKRNLYHQDESLSDARRAELMYRILAHVVATVSDDWLISSSNPELDIWAMAQDLLTETRFGAALDRLAGSLCGTSVSAVTAAAETVDAVHDVKAGALALRTGPMQRQLEVVEAMLDNMRRLSTKSDDLAQQLNRLIEGHDWVRVEVDHGASSSSSRDDKVPTRTMTVSSGGWRLPFFCQNADEPVETISRTFYVVPHPTDQFGTVWEWYNTESEFDAKQRDEMGRTKAPAKSWGADEEDHSAETEDGKGSTSADVTGEQELWPEGKPEPRRIRILDNIVDNIARGAEMFGELEEVMGRLMA